MSLWVIYYGVLVGVLVPVHCVRSYFKLKAGMPYPSKPRIYIQTLAFLGVFLLLAYCAWRPFWSALFPPLVFRARDLALGAAALIVSVAGMYPFWKRSAIRRREK